MRAPASKARGRSTRETLPVARKLAPSPHFEQPAPRRIEPRRGLLDGHPGRARHLRAGLRRLHRQVSVLDRGRTVQPPCDTRDAALPAVEHAVEFLGVEQVVPPLDAIRIDRGQAGKEPAERRAELTHHEPHRIHRHPLEGRLAEHIGGVEVELREQRVVVEHLLEVRHLPGRVHRVAEEPPPIWSRSPSEAIAPKVRRRNPRALRTARGAARRGAAQAAARTETSAAGRSRPRARRPSPMPAG